MKIAQLLLSRTTIGVLVTIAILIAFNSTRTDLKTAGLASFTAWHTKTAVLLNDANPEVTPPKVTVTIRMNQASPGLAPQTWSFPSLSITDATDRAHTTRVLQLINESRIFGLAKADSNDTTIPTLTVTITDENERFETSVPLRDIESNIQLQNLLKLLQVFSATPKTAGTTLQE
jgi:hypothetical protein